MIVVTTTATAGILSPESMVSVRKAQITQELIICGTHLCYFAPYLSCLCRVHDLDPDSYCESYAAKVAHAHRSLDVVEGGRCRVRSVVSSARPAPWSDGRLDGAGHLSNWVYTYRYLPVERVGERRSHDHDYLYCRVEDVLHQVVAVSHQAGVGEHVSGRRAEAVGDVVVVHALVVLRYSAAHRADDLDVMVVGCRTRLEGPDFDQGDHR